MIPLPRDYAVAEHGCTWAGITRHRSPAQASSDGARSLTTAAITNPLVERADHWQYELQQGPCVDATLLGETLVLKDTSHGGPWPPWAAQAHQLGIDAVLSVHLATATETIGGLNL